MTDASSEPKPTEPWWGSYTMETDVPHRWRIGPFELYVERTARQWRTARRQHGDPLDARIERAIAVSREEMDGIIHSEDPEIVVSRFPFRETDPGLKLDPALADRAVVIRPETPLYVVPGESITLFVSTPLWIRIRTGEPGSVLEDVPSYRPSDTWFGSSTREGELCYATRTAGRIALANLPQRRHRAVTPARIHNRASDTLLVERLQLPVQVLPLYVSETGFVWTPGVRLNRERKEDPATVTVEEGPPEEALGADRIAGPRTESRSNLVMRTFGALGGLFH